MSLILSGSDGISTGATNLTPTELSYLDGIRSGIQEQIDNKYTGFKNYILNGNFNVWQYKDAGFTYPQTASGYGSDDRWANLNTGSTKTHSRIYCTDVERALFNAAYFSRTVVTSVAGDGNYIIKLQNIEDVTRLAGKTVTLSFWAKADSSKNISLSWRQNFGTGGSPSAEIIGQNSSVISLTSSWQKYIINVNIPSTVGKTLGTDGVHTSFTQLSFIFDAGLTIATAWNIPTLQQSGTFDIAQIQLEEGSVATPFESRPYQLEVYLCQRYFEPIEGLFTGYATSSTPCNFNICFKVKKRITPTITFNSITTFWNSAGTSVTATVYSTTPSGNATQAGTTLFTTNPSSNPAGSAVSFKLVNGDAYASAE